MNRIERLWLVSDGEKPADELLKAHPDLSLAKAMNHRVMNVLGEAGVPTIHLVDRRGLVVYRYPYD